MMTNNKNCTNCRYGSQDEDKDPCNVCLHMACAYKEQYTRWEPEDDDDTPEDEPIEDEHFDTHYAGTIQPTEFMQAQMTHEELVGFLKGNIIKYVARCGKKDDPVKEAAKIKRYAEWLEKALRGDKINPRD